ncbi:MAG: hypothetical protein GJV46_10900 [Geobacter sp.]|nr:hypothetical protein [Geobacter sp.]
MLTLISLTIVMYLMYMITAGVQMSGANKRYKTALEASYGSTDVVLKDVLPIVFTNLSTPVTALSASGFASSLDLSPSAGSCLKQKLTRPASKWSAACSNSTDAKTGADITLTLNSTTASPFKVYTKIVETMCSDPRPYPAGNCTGSDLSGLTLDSGSSVAGGNNGVTVQHLPATYRIEVQGERSTNPLEKAKLSVLYAY